MRLTRVGGKKDPVWRVVVADRRSPRDGRVIETIGRYNAQTEPSTIRSTRSAPATGSARAPSRPTRCASCSRPRASSPPRASCSCASCSSTSSRALVDKPDQVKVEEFEEDDGTLVFELSVDDDDYGRVIGRGGRTAQALRTRHQGRRGQGQPPRPPRHRRVSGAVPRGGARRPRPRPRRLLPRHRPAPAAARRSARRPTSARSSAAPAPTSSRSCACAAATTPRGGRGAARDRAAGRARRRAGARGGRVVGARARGLRGDRRRARGRDACREMRELPSVEVLEVEREDGAELLVPMVARRRSARSTSTARRIDVDLGFLDAD